MWRNGRKLCMNVRRTNPAESLVNTKISKNVIRVNFHWCVIGVRRLTPNVLDESRNQISRYTFSFFSFLFCSVSFFSLHLVCSLFLRLASVIVLFAVLVSLFICYFNLRRPRITSKYSTHRRHQHSDVLFCFVDYFLNVNIVPRVPFVILFFWFSSFDLVIYFFVAIILEYFRFLLCMAHERSAPLSLFIRRIIINCMRK